MYRTRTLLIKIVMQAVHFIIVLLGISFLTFSIMHLSPRNPAELWLVGADGSAGMVSEEAVAEQERIMGLDRPFLVQYGTWLGNAVRGDLGTSFTYRTPGLLPGIILSAAGLVLLAVYLVVMRRKDRAAEAAVPENFRSLRREEEPGALPGGSAQETAPEHGANDTAGTLPPAEKEADGDASE